MITIRSVLSTGALSLALAGCASKSNTVNVGVQEDAATPQCQHGDMRCNPDTFIFEQCRDDGLGFETLPGSSPCASGTLCEQGVQASPPACPEPACSAGDARCVDGAGESCKADLTGWSANGDCGSESKQCNPRVGECALIPIDAYEVTREAYKAFVDDAGWSAKATPPPGCAWKKPGSSFDFTPDDWTAQLQNPQLPVVGVDWCDAYVYCAWAGQHLCGQIDGGMVAYDSYADAGLSEWQNACSSGGELDYPYGTSYQSQSCNDGGKTKNGAVEGLFPGGASEVAQCRSPRPAYASAVNLLGNVGEWENSCNKDATVQAAGAGASDRCRVRGGDTTTPIGDMAQGCGFSPADPVPRDRRSATIGFRCCGLSMN